jgi:Ca-activated chloride channel family protein
MPLLTARFAPDRPAIDPTKDANRLFVVAELVAKGDGVERERPPLDAVLALDVSGSMQGPPIAQVIASVGQIADLFQQTDRVGIVAFSNNATLVCAPEPMNESGKRLLRLRAARLAADGGTGIQAGLELSEATLVQQKREGARRTVLLLSDGAPNVGAATPEALAQIVTGMRQNLSVSTLGYGMNHNEDVLSRISDAGGGRYFFVQDPQRCQHEFAMAVGSQADMVVDGVELSFAPAAGVRILRVLGAAQSGFSAAGLSVALGDMTDGQVRRVALEIETGKMDPQKLAGELVSMRVSYKRAGGAEAFTANETAIVDLRAGGAKPEGTAACNVFVLRAEETRAEARAFADRGQWEGAAAAIRKLMKEMEESGLFAKNDGSELSEVFELLLDEAMAFERRPSAEQYQQFRKDAVRSTLYTAGAQQKHTRGASARVLSRTAGNFPEAYLVEIRGAGTRHLLGASCVLGRTADADIVILSERVSRRHADVYALQGEFWVCDLGSTNTTCVNGQRLASAPHKLANGDVLELGGVELRYEEKAP